MFGGFHDLKSFRAELGADVAGMSDAEAMQIIDENLQEKAKLSIDARADLDETDPAVYDDSVYRNMVENMRSKANAEERERKRLAQELAARNAEKAALITTQNKLRADLEMAKIKNANDARFVWKSPSTLEDFISKEKIKQELKDELRREKQQKERQIKEELIKEKILKEELRLLRKQGKPKAARSKSRSKSRKPKTRGRSRTKAKK